MVIRALPVRREEVASKVALAPARKVLWVAKGVAAARDTLACKVARVRKVAVVCKAKKAHKVCAAARAHEGRKVAVGHKVAEVFRACVAHKG